MFLQVINNRARMLSSCWWDLIVSWRKYELIAHIMACTKIGVKGENETVSGEKAQKRAYGIVTDEF